MGRKVNHLISAYTTVLCTAVHPGWTLVTVPLGTVLDGRTAVPAMAGMALHRRDMTGASHMLAALLVAAVAGAGAGVAPAFLHVSPSTIQQPPDAIHQSRRALQEAGSGSSECDAYLQYAPGGQTMAAQLQLITQTCAPVCLLLFLSSFVSLRPNC